MVTLYSYYSGECVVHMMIHVHVCRWCLTSCSSGRSWSHCCFDPSDHNSLNTPDTTQVMYSCTTLDSIYCKCKCIAPSTSTHTRRRVSRGSVKVKSKPLPPLRSLKEREREEEEEEEMEMRELVASTEEDKDDYYFEDPSNISEFIVI